MTGLDLLVLGDLNPDLILSGGDVVPEFGQVEHLVEAAELTIGGSGAIAACGAARLGLHTGIVGIVGDDLFGRFMLGALEERGVNVDGVTVDPGARTGLTVVMSAAGDRAMLTFPGAIAALDAGQVPGELLRSARHVHVASYFLQHALVPGLPRLFDDARAAGATTSVDPNWDPTERWEMGLRELLVSTDLLMPNREEAVRIAGRADPELAARSLSGAGPLVAVKLGSDGALAAGRDEVVRVPAAASIEPLDTTGAGDSFDAGMIAGRLAGWDTRQALALACACGAISTQAVGGTGAQPTMRQALALLEGPGSAVATGSEPG